MGKVFSMHAIELKPGVTDAEFAAFVQDVRYAVPGQTVYLAQGTLGARSGQYAVIIEYASADLFARYFPDGSHSDEFNQLIAPFQAEMARLSQLTTWPDPAHTVYQVLGQTH